MRAKEFPATKGLQAEHKWRQWTDIVKAVGNLQNLDFRVDDERTIISGLRNSSHGSVLEVLVQ